MAAFAGGGASPPPLPASTSKGKAKMDDEAAEAPTCGICLTKSGDAIPGELDCCAHRFCFVCIMVWGRVESRCPFCKARFRTIRRPPVPGRFPSERVVPVPERNQVYHPGGNASSTVGADPYADTICTVCNCSRDDELVMLCDLCDSAAHTYCVGLGNVVPDGDWFCKDCAVSREEHLRLQVGNEGWGGQREFQIRIEAPRAELVAAPSASDVVEEDYGLSGTNVQHTSLSVPSIYDIVDDDYTTNIRSNRPRRNAEDLPSQGTSSECPDSTRGRDNGLASYHAQIRSEVERVRTLRNSRNLEKRIRALRENWAALRDGSVGFTAHVPATISVVSEHQSCATPIVIGNRNGAAATSVQLSSTPSSEETSTSLGHGSKILQKDTRDARKAWKMLQMAKSSGGKKISNKLASLNCAPPFSMGNRSTSCSPIDTILQQKNQNLPNKVTPKGNANCGHGTKMENTPPTRMSREFLSLHENNRVSVHERVTSFQNRINQESLNGKVASSIQGHYVDQTLGPLCSTDRSEKFISDMPHPLKCSLSSDQSTVTSLPQLGPSAGNQSTMMVNHEESSAACVAAANENGTTATVVVRESSVPERHERQGKPSADCVAAANENGTAATVIVRESSVPEHHERKRKLSSEKGHDRGSKRSRSTSKIAKSEISSLAIRELKLLKIDKTYGSDRFKEAARTATHTVLAACGFEHSPSQSLTLSGPVCEHSPKVDPLKSSAITNWCTECLRSFVKEAVSLVLSSRQTDQTGPSC